MLSQALAKSVEDRGGKVCYGAEVKRLLIENGKAVGVELKKGEKISARVVLSSLDARTTFLGLVGAEWLPSDFVQSVKEIDYRNGYIQIHMTLKELPEFTGHLKFANENNIRWLMAYIPSPEHIARHWEKYRKGEVADDPLSYCAFPSVMDPSLALAGHYTCTIFAPFFPYNIPEGKLNELSRLMAERAINQIAKHAPNFRAAIIDKAILTHRYFESTCGVSGGDYSSGLIHPEQMWDRRPVLGWAHYGTPIENLFMCGSACHPGPGVTCVPGYNCANKVLEAWERRIG